MRSPFVFASLVTLAALTGCREKTQVGVYDGGLTCEPKHRLINGECTFVCVRDGDCEAGQECNLFTGKCQPKTERDAGMQLAVCTTGAERCTADAKAIERCQENGTWSTFTTCPAPKGYCKDEKCLACQPGLAECVPGNAKEVSVCKDDGSGPRTIVCQGSASCVQGECRECTPGATRCGPFTRTLADGGTSSETTVQTCTHSTNEAEGWKWVNSGDTFDGSCLTRVCELSTTTQMAACKMPACFPGQSQCVNSTTQQTCEEWGAWKNVTCSSLPGYSSAAECQNGTCVDECADAVAAKSYFGCEYWTAVMDNVVDNIFKANTTSGQGTSPSEFAIVVTNRSTVAANITVTRIFNGAMQSVIADVIPGKGDAATKGLKIFKLPWGSIGDSPAVPTAASSQSSSGLKRFGYRITTTRPVTVYQFNPLDAVKNGTYSYSNDASLLLPRHILGTGYVAMTPEHITRRLTTDNSYIGAMANANITIVAPENGTTVTVKTNATVLAGSAVQPMARGDTRTFNLGAYDVLQLASGDPTNTTPSGNLECVDNPYDQFANPTCGLFGTCTSLCRVDNDFTGSIITSNKPIAVFGGSACTLRPFDKPACDHVEEQLFPFSTWGKNFVGARTAPLRLTSGTFATAVNAGPDYYKIVAGLNGTALTITPTPPQSDVLSPNRCSSGNPWTNTCVLAAGSFIEFKARTSVTISATEPIQVGQFFAGQEATLGTPRPNQGDPSFVLLPPVEQWRSNYTVLTAPGTRDNYLGLVIDNTRVLSVQVDGTAVSGFTAIGTTPYRFLNVPVATGTHTINVIAKPGVTQQPGAGVTVYGFDEYVSYGYTGGLDLTTIVPGINPGG